MQTDIRRGEETQWRERLNLLALIFGLAVGGAILYKLAGPPRLPEHIPSVTELLVFLNGDEVPLAALAYIFTMAAWLVWIWLVASIALRVLVDVSETIARGAVWVGALRSFSDSVTLPVVRRVVDGAIVAAVVVNLVARTSMTASAAPLTQETTQAVVEVRPSDTTEQKTAAEPQKTKRVVDYKVVPGDTLWTIAERFYGTGEEFPRLVDANAGRAMPDGDEFTRQGVIQPGWVLRIPMPSQTLVEEDGQVFYVVERGDTLWGISARFLGNPTRWSEVFELNRGSARLPNGWTLTNPNLIWPGLRLRLPLALEDIPVALPGPDPLTLVPPPISERPVRHESPVIRSVPTVAPATPTVVAPTAAPTSVPTPLPTAVPVETSRADLPPFLVLGALGAGAIAATGAAVMLRRRTRRSLDEPPIASDEPALPKADFAEAEFTRILSHRLQGGEAEPAIIVAGQVLHFLKDNGIQDVRIVTAKQGRSSITLAIQAGLLAEQRILELAPRLSTHLGGTVEASLNADHDVLLQVTGLKMSMLLAPSAPLPDLPLLLPLGVTTRRDGVYGGWQELGHVLVAGLPGSGPEVVLISLASALAARCRPEEVGLLTIAGHRTLPPQLAALPHQREGFVDPSDAASVQRILDDLQGELTRRIASAKQGDATARPPERVLVIGELADLKDHEMELETLAAHGAAYGIHIIAATGRPEELTVDSMSGFSTRVILQLLDDDQSIRLLGEPAAADLSHGELVVRIDGRSPIRLRGLRVSPDHLDQMVRLMQTAYTRRPPEPPNNGNGGSPSEPAQIEATDDAADPPDVPAASRVKNGDSPQEEQPVVAVAAPIAPVANAAVHTEPALNGHVVDVKPKGHNGVARFVRPDMPELPDGIELLGANAAVYIQCFGTFQVHAGDQLITSVNDEGAAYKPWEMLVFMAVQPDGQVSRDRLVGALWPESDMALGTNNMRVVMSRLRGLLKKSVPGLTTEVLGCDRDTICRLDLSRVVSDVQQFVALVKASRKLPTPEAIAALRYALALYQGDLLSDANTPFYSWAEDREERGVSLLEYYQEEHKHATQRLAQLLLESGQAREAIPLLKSLLKAEPTLEAVVRDLYRCYQQTGDLNALIREDLTLRQALRAIYKDAPDAALDGRHWEPEADTIALYATIRAELESRSSAPDRLATPDISR